MKTEPQPELRPGRPDSISKKGAVKVAACVVLSLLAGFVGLIGSAVIGGLGICAMEVNIPVCVVLVGLGFVAAVFGCTCGQKIGWIPAAVYCLPIAVLGGILPATSHEWSRVIASWGIIAAVALGYAAIEAGARGKLKFM